MTRLLVIANRYWPCIDDATLRLMHWLDGLKTQNIQPTVLTARQEANWPDRFELRGVPVHRLLPAPNTAWNESHFCRNVTQWVLKHSMQFDAIYCDRIDSTLSLLATKGAKWAQPILARFSPYQSINGTFEPETQAPNFPMESARRCDLVITPNAAGHRFLVSQGVPDERILRLSDTYWNRVERDSTSRIAAFKSLASLSGDFIVPRDAKLIVHLGVAKWSSLKETLQSVCDLIDSGASIRFWIVNCGIPYQVVYDYLKDRGWHREILIFDGFDDQDTLLQSADLLWFSSPFETLQFSLANAAAAGVPFMAKECSELKEYLTKDYPHLFYGSPTDLALNLHHWYVNPDCISLEMQSLRQEFLSSANPSNGLQRFASACRNAITEKAMGVRK